MSISTDTYECAKRKCKHRFKGSEMAYVKPKVRPGPKTLAKTIGTCPKCGNDSFYIVEKNP